MKTISHYFGYFVFFIFLSACSNNNLLNGTYGSDSRIASAGLDANTRKNSEAIYRYLRGHVSLAKQDLPEAEVNLSKASDLIGRDAPSLYIQLARLYMQEGRFDESEKEIKKALLTDPDNEQFLLILAGNYEALERDEEAEEIYKKIIAGKTKSFDAYILLSGLYVKKQAYSKAIDVLQALLKDKKFAVFGHYYLGHIYELQSRFEDAEREYLLVYQDADKKENVVEDLVRIYISSDGVDKAISFCLDNLEKDPKNATLRRTLAQLYLEQKDFDNAVKHFKILSKEEENPNESLLKIALVRIQQGKIAEAQKDLLALLDRAPDFDEARYYLGFTYVFDKKIMAAIEMLQEVKAPKEMVVKSRSYAAFLLSQIGDFKRAALMAREGLTADPGDKKLLSAYVSYLKNDKRYQEAADVIKKALKYGEDDTDLIFQYGVALHEAGNRSEALTQMKRILELMPDNVDALNFIAYSYAEDGRNLNEALRMIKRAVELKPGDGYFLDTLGWVYYRLRRYSDAVTALEQAVALVQTDAVIYEHYGDALIKRNGMKEALAAYKKCLALKVSDTDGRDAQKRVKDKIAKLCEDEALCENKDEH